MPPSLQMPAAHDQGGGGCQCTSWSPCLATRTSERYERIGRAMYNHDRGDAAIDSHVRKERAHWSPLGKARSTGGRAVDKDSCSLRGLHRYLLCRGVFAAPRPGSRVRG